jgi:hypothetical protein
MTAKPFTQLLQIAAGHGYTGASPTTRNGLSPGDAKALADALSQAATRKPTEYERGNIGAVEWIEKCATGEIDVA